MNFAFLARLAILGAAVLRVAAQDVPGGAPASQPASQPATQPAHSPVLGTDYETMPVADIVARADELREQGEVQEAERAIRFALARERNNVAALAVAGEIYILKSDIEEARKSFLQALSVQRTDFRSNLGLGRIWAAKKDWRQARRYLADAASVAPPDRAGEVLTLLAQSYGGSGLYKLAIETAERAVQTAPQLYEARKTLVLLRTSAGDFESAIAETRALLELAQADAAKTPVKKEQLEELRDAYEIKSTVLKNYQSQFFVRNPDGTYSDRIIAGKESDSASVLSQLVEVLALQIELDRRIAFFTGVAIAERMVSLDAGKANYWIQLGLLHKNTFNNDAAGQAFRRALEIEPGNEIARRELDALQADTPMNN